MLSFLKTMFEKYNDGKQDNFPEDVGDVSPDKPPKEEKEINIEIKNLTS